MFLGIDCSTQSLSAVVIDPARGRVVNTESVWYGEEFPQYNSPKGVLPSKDPLVKCADPLMWLDALERLFEKLRNNGVPMDRIEGIGGSAQLGTVYLDARFHLGGWLDNATAPLRDIIRPFLTRDVSPIWMDNSTFDDCMAFESRLGGRAAIQAITGSMPAERFAAPQIHNFSRTNPAAYEKTSVIHLVSSFLCSVLIGQSAAIDYGDGCSTSLMNLRQCAWEPSLLDATAPGLADRLPRLEPSSAICGQLHPYFLRFGFHPSTEVMIWSNDNLMRLIGIGGWKTGTAGITLGTSDTFFSAMDKIGADPAGCGNVFVNPAGNYMSLVCFKNGSFAREAVCERYGLSWAQFDNDAFELTPPGNGGNLMLPYFTPEITPLVLNACPFYKGNSLFMEQKDPCAMVRALVESQAMSMRIHSHWIGNRPKRMRVTGGASRSPGMCQVFADVFNAVVERPSVEMTAALGSAIRAAQRLSDRDWSSLSRLFCTSDPSRIVRPVEANVEIYNDLVPQYAAFEREITG